MANRRMISRDIEDSRAFNQMSAASQALYNKIVLHADDEGFRDDVETDMFQSHASAVDYQALISNGFLLETPDGNVKIVKHWFQSNTVDKAHFKRTQYEELEAGLYVKDNGSYTRHEEKSSDTIGSFLNKKYGVIPKLGTNCAQNVPKMCSKVSLVKSSLVKSSKEYVQESLNNAPTREEEPSSETDMTEKDIDESKKIANELWGGNKK